MLVRTGYYARRLAEGPTSPLQTGSPGPQAALLPWLKERGVAVWGSDNTHNDVSPTPYPSMGSPFHIGALVGLGLWLVDNMNLEDIAAACTDRSRWEFLLTLAPLRLRNVTGSPLNPIALF